MHLTARLICQQQRGQSIKGRVYSIDYTIAVHNELRALSDLLEITGQIEGRASPIGAQELLVSFRLCGGEAQALQLLLIGREEHQQP